ncbi:MAG: biopolymer transporter ExbD [Candidatus Krumholzibacteriia bacterium]
MLTSSFSLTTRRPSRLAELPELDVTPVMNMFIILIPFLVSLAVFAQVSAHRVGLPADDAGPVSRTAAEVPLTVALGADRVALAWGGREVAALDLAGDVAPGPGVLDGLDALLARERARRPDMARVVVAVDDGVSCALVVGCLDRCRAAGYDDVGLAAGGGLAGDRAEVRR